MDLLCAYTQDCSRPRSATQRIRDQLGFIDHGDIIFFTKIDHLHRGRHHRIARHINAFFPGTHTAIHTTAVQSVIDLICKQTQRAGIQTMIRRFQTFQRIMCFSGIGRSVMDDKLSLHQTRIRIQIHIRIGDTLQQMLPDTAPALFPVGDIFLQLQFLIPFQVLKTALQIKVFYDLVLQISVHIDTLILQKLNDHTTVFSGFQTSFDDCQPWVLLRKIPAKTLHIRVLPGPGAYTVLIKESPVHHLIFKGRNIPCRKPFPRLRLSDIKLYLDRLQLFRNRTDHPFLRLLQRSHCLFTPAFFPKDITQCRLHDLLIVFQGMICKIRLRQFIFFTDPRYGKRIRTVQILHHFIVYRRLFPVIDIPLLFLIHFIHSFFLSGSHRKRLHSFSPAFRSRHAALSPDIHERTSNTVCIPYCSHL